MTPRAGVTCVPKPTVKRMAPVLVVSAADFWLRRMVLIGEGTAARNVWAGVHRVMLTQALLAPT